MNVEDNIKLVYEMSNDLTDNYWDMFSLFWFYKDNADMENAHIVDREIEKICDKLNEDIAKHA